MYAEETLSTNVVNDLKLSAEIFQFRARLHEKPLYFFAEASTAETDLI